MQKTAAAVHWQAGAFIVKMPNAEPWMFPSVRKRTIFPKLCWKKLTVTEAAKYMAIVEPVFANIRVQKRMDRFTLRGKIKVNIQWMLYCMVHNIEKIINYATA